MYVGAREQLPDLSELTTAQVLEAHLEPQLRAKRSSCVWQMLNAPTRLPAFAVLHCPAASFQGLVRSLQVPYRCPPPISFACGPAAGGPGTRAGGRGQQKPGDAFSGFYLRLLIGINTRHTSLDSSGMQAPSWVL